MKKTVKRYYKSGLEDRFDEDAGIREDELGKVYRALEMEELQKPEIERRAEHQGTRIEEIRTKIRESMPGMEKETDEPLKLAGSKVIGNLFDRIDFLRQRIDEMNGAIETRKNLHEEIIAEIDADIEDKTRSLSTLTDTDDIRDFKLDISLLRAEKRKENLKFWKDLLELRSELRKLKEEYETEGKIAELFKDANI